MANGDGENGKKGDSEQGRTVKRRDVIIFSIAVGAMLLVLAVVLLKGGSEQVALVSAVLGPLATVTAAVFGVSVGNNAGEAKGKAQGEAEADSAKKSEQKMSASIKALGPLITDTMQSIQSHHSDLTKSFSSPTGIGSLQLQASDFQRDEIKTVDPSGLRHAMSKLAELRGRIEQISR